MSRTPACSAGLVPVAPQLIVDATANPFATRFVRPGSIQFQYDAQTDPGKLVDVIINHRRSVIVGRHGSGKSTLLHDLMPRLHRVGATIKHLRLFAPESNSWLARRRQAKQNIGLLTAAGSELSLLRLQCKSTRSPVILLVIDGLEQLSWMARMRLVSWSRRRDIRILGTAHRAVMGFSEVYRTRMDEISIRRLTESLISECDSETQGHVRGELDRRDLNSIVDLRSFWFELYDVVATTK